MLSGFGFALALGVVGLATGFVAAIWLQRSQTSARPSSSSVEGGHEINHDTVRHRLRMAGHDIRSSLGPIVGYADLIKISNDITQAQLHADKIAQAANKIESLANDLTDSVLGPEQ